MAKMCNSELIFIKFSQYQSLKNQSLKVQSLKESSSMRENCLHLELFSSIFSTIWTEYVEIQSISVRTLGNTDQNNSEYGRFFRSA